MTGRRASCTRAAARHTLSKRDQKTPLYARVSPLRRVSKTPRIVLVGIGKDRAPCLEEEQHGPDDRTRQTTGARLQDAACPRPSSRPRGVGIAGDVLSHRADLSPSALQNRVSLPTAAHHFKFLQLLSSRVAPPTKGWPRPAARPFPKHGSSRPARPPCPSAASKQCCRPPLRVAGPQATGADARKADESPRGEALPTRAERVNSSPLPPSVRRQEALIENAPDDTTCRPHGG